VHAQWELMGVDGQDKLRRVELRTGQQRHTLPCAKAFVRAVRVCSLLGFFLCVDAAELYQRLIVSSGVQSEPWLVADVWKLVIDFLAYVRGMTRTGHEFGRLLFTPCNQKTGEVHTVPLASALPLVQVSCITSAPSEKGYSLYVSDQHRIWHIDTKGGVCCRPLRPPPPPLLSSSAFDLTGLFLFAAEGQVLK
jgi:hypothetical protein